MAAAGTRKKGDETIAEFLRRSEPARGIALLSPTMIAMGTALAAPLVLLALYSFWSQYGLTLDTSFTLDQYTTPSGGRAIARCSTARSASPRW